jgi:hypothetical protein
LGKPSWAAFSNPFASELAGDHVNTPLIRCADYPAFLRFARDDWNIENENAGLRLACQAGRRFAKVSASLLASVF